MVLFPSFWGIRVFFLFKTLHNHLVSLEGYDVDGAGE